MKRQRGSTSTRFSLVPHNAQACCAALTVIRACVCLCYLCIMAPKHDLAGKTDSAAKKSSRKTITIEQKVDIIRRYERGETTNVVRLALGLPENKLRII